MNSHKNSTPLPIGKISSELREIYHSDEIQAEKAMETYLELMLKGLSSDEKRAGMEDILAVFRPATIAPDDTPAEPDRLDDLCRFFSLLLGHDVPTDKLSSSELMQRLSDSLNTIFNSLNELVSAINNSITRDISPDKTIRQLISYHLGDEHHLQELAAYIGRIKHTFLITQEAYKMSVQTIVDNILKEFDPERIQSESPGKFGFGAIKKAQYYDVFEKKYGKYRNWVESGRFMESFLREFEKNCHNQSKSLNNL